MSAERRCAAGRESMCTPGLGVQGLVVRMLQCAAGIIAAAIMAFALYRRVCCGEMDQTVSRDGVWLALAILFSLLSAAVGWIPARPAMLCFFSMAGIFCVVAASRLLSFDLFSWHSKEWHAFKRDNQIEQFDGVLGYDLIPSSTATHRYKDLKATYTIDSDKCRVTPNPHRPLGTVLITGCSYTMGVWVNDAETYPYVLAARYWKEYKIRNRSCGGWSTTQADLIVSEALASKKKPRVIIYGMMAGSAHRMRNYLRKSWLESMRMAKEPILRARRGDRFIRGHPHFELCDGQLKYLGVVGTEAAVNDDAPELEAKEQAITAALLKDMHRRCQKDGVPFVVVILPNKWQLRVDPEIEAVMQTDRIPYLDLSYIRVSTSPYDTHPDARVYEHIAKAMAQSFISGILYERGFQSILAQRGST